MQFRILGPLEVWADGHELELGAGRQRALLALLLLHANEVVSADRLIDELWQERPPPSAAKVMQGYVSQLRRVLPAATIDTHPTGYLLRAGSTDAGDFERLVAVAGTQRPAEAARTLRTALALWRGPPLADVEYELWAQTEIARLEQLRLVALEARVEADIQSTAEPGLVSELEQLVAEHPLRERLRAQLMLALYREGRQADALQVYADTRKKLVEELGIEPGPELHELHRRILAQDASLQPVAHPLAAAARRAPWLILVGGLLLAGAAAAVALQLSTTGGSRLVAPNSIGVIDPVSNRVIAGIPVGDTPTSVAVGGGAVWALNANEDTLSRIDPRAMTVVRSIGAGPAPVALAFGGGALWVAGRSHAMLRIDPTAYLARTMPIPRARGQADTLQASWVASDGAAVWATNDATLSRLAPGPLFTAHATTFTCCGPIAIGAGSVWAADDTGVLRVDAQTGDRQAQVRLPFAPADVAVGAGSVWVTDQDRNAVWRIDARSNTVVGTITVGDHPGGVAAGAGSIWVASGDGSVARIDPALNRVTRTIRVGGTPNDVVFGAGKVWVSID